MDTIRWIVVCVVLLPAAVYTTFNFGLAVRNLIFYADRGPSWIPLVGFLAAIVGLLAVPKNDSTVSGVAVFAFATFILFDVSYIAVGVFNAVRSRLTGRPPS
ncbi:hypothetical protein Pla22_47320 [Rubripirellula amarantea]|uniref:Uncharacterized protein n=1 Tax=Rubripirellula amarantea TaxID=2527999 RepID=A0A5C5WHH3_9BACT|nr:hypothetical protein [Rubripirellula amarantea]TWT49535.1 hypothetical protein Pla22_47320 [Rubripirellula amarantea]